MSDLTLLKDYLRLREAARKLIEEAAEARKKCEENLCKECKGSGATDTGQCGKCLSTGLSQGVIYRIVTDYFFRPEAGVIKRHAHVANERVKSPALAERWAQLRPEDGPVEDEN